MSSSKVLTLFLTKDFSSFNHDNYVRVLKQKGIDQDVYVVSAEPVPVKNNIVVKVPQHLPVPIRVGLSINLALRRFDLSRYSHIFKVDGDVALPLDYLQNLLEKKTPVAGIGAAMLISMEFFVKALKGKYPVSYCDDGYVTALSIAMGYWPPEYTGEGYLNIPVIRQSLREFSYGVEYYKWGFPLPLYAPFLLFFRKKDLKSVLYNMAGYLHAFMFRERKYEWWRRYLYHRLIRSVTRALSRIKKIL